MICNFKDKRTARLASQGLETKPRPDAVEEEYPDQAVVGVQPRETLGMAGR